MALAIFEAVMGNELTCLLITSSVSCSVPIEDTDFISVDVSDNGNRDNASTLAFCFDVRYLKSNVYAASWIAHHCNREAASTGIPFFGPSMYVNALRSVNNRKCPP